MTTQTAGARRAPLPVRPMPNRAGYFGEFGGKYVP
jgi:hypothetical protein